METARKASVAQHQELLDDRKRVTSLLEDARTQVRDLQARAQELTDERVELLRRISLIDDAKSVEAAKRRQLESVNETLPKALSQMLRKSEVDRTARTTVPVEGGEPVEARTGAEVPHAQAALARRAPSTGPAAASSVPGQKKTLQFTQRARDAERVKIHRGVYVDLDDIPGELVDLSLGGAQVVMRQMVKPNQVTRLTILMPAGQVICKGRVVWTDFEERTTSISVFRAGIRFSDADPVAVRNVMNDFCEKSVRKKDHSSGAA
jgi:hypothetical protein